MTTYFLLATDNNKALSISLPASAPLVLAAINPLDKNQHFSLAPGSEGLFVVSRTNGQVLDITASYVVAGNPVSVYDQKPSSNENQRFTFTSPSTITAVGTKLNVVAAADGIKLILGTNAQIFTAIPVPAEYAVTITNSTGNPITVTYDNAPASETTKSWTVAPGAVLTANLLNGATISVRDASGKVLPPTPYLVSKSDTLTFQDAPVAKLIYYSQLGQQGESIEYTADEPHLSTRGWQDKPLSFRVVAGSWIIYQDDYSGNKIVANPRGGKNLDGNYEYLVAVWGGYPATLVGVNSHRLLPEAGLALFDYPEFMLNNLNLNDDVSDLTTLNFANKINSILVVSGIWELWDRPDFQGAKRIISVDGGRDGTGWYNLYNQWGGRPNSIMSIRKHVPQGDVCHRQ